MKRSTLRRFEAIKPRGLRVSIGALHPANRSGRSIFPSRVYDPDELPRLLVSGHNSRKIGKEVQKGRWRGFPIYTLTLEERATCPRTCNSWSTCYGNGMQWAHRIVAGADLEAGLRVELVALQAEHPSGFAVRLHVLGDFYSLDYAALWEAALDLLPALHVFGFTARHPVLDPIGVELMRMAGDRWDRFAIRFSGFDFPERGSVVVHNEGETRHTICPAQTGGTDCCATCALCWHSQRSIAFLAH